MLLVKNMAKIGRNEPCWCGSGKKYKKCHLDRENQPSFSKADAHRAVNSFVSKRDCYVPKELKVECSSKIINAHTVSKSASLKPIASNGHVMTPMASLKIFDETGGKLKIQKIGINKASTLTGFCAKHDKELFAPIEDEDFSLTSEKLFLLAYRPIVRELYAKETSSKRSIEVIRESDKGTSFINQISTQHFASDYEMGVDLGIRDLRFLKSELDSMLVQKKWENLKHYVFELEGIANIVSSFSCMPEQSFDGKTIQTLGPEIELPNIGIFNLVNFKNKSYFVCSWIEQHADFMMNDFISTLTSKPLDRVGDMIIGFILTYAENVFMSPKWWGGLSEEIKALVNEKCNSGANPFNERSVDCLVDDGFELNAIRVINHFEVVIEEEK